MDSKDTNKIIAEARKVFLRYGFRRTTMGDLAQAAQMSRPALYLIFPSKEDVFVAVMRHFLAETLDHIRREIAKLPTAAEKLTFAFEVWCVRPFEIVQASPDASDLLESGSNIAGNIMAQGKADFEAIVAEVLKPLVRESRGTTLSAARVAEILFGAMHGFKHTAANAAELRRLLHDHLKLVLTALGRE